MRTFNGYDLVYSEDDEGWYAQDFSDPKQPTTTVYESLDLLKEAIRNGSAIFR